MKRSVRILLFVCLTVLTAVAFVGCDALESIGVTQPAATMPPMTAEYYTDYDAVYVHYNQVTFADTRQTLTERFGEPEAIETENGFNYFWHMDDGYGFICTFYETGELRAKVVYYEDVRQFRDLSNSVNLSTVEDFDKEVNFQTCVSVFAGRPIELGQISNSIDGSDISRIYCWLDSNSSIVQILFKADGTIDSMSYNAQ